MSDDDGTAAVPQEDLWQVNARWWQDGFTDGADPEYTEQILPLAAAHLASARRVLDVGCGEGQVARLAVKGGAGFVVGVDPTAAQLDVAAQRAGGVAYGRASADALPFADASFDAVVACLVFEHIDAVDDALREVGRMLTAGGRFLFFLNHPLLQTPNSGWIDDQVLDPPEQYWRIGDYLVEDRTIEEVEKDIFIPFIHRPLSRYVNGMAAAGLPPDKIEWKQGSGRNQQAVLAGDPSKPGLYVVMVKWLPGGMSRPHFHPNDRFITVLKGTWWVGTGSKFDPNSTVPMPAGTFVTHFGKQVHYDGAKDEEAVLLITGEGPATSTAAEEK